MDFIANPANEKSAKICSRCQKQCEKWNVEGSHRNPDSQVNLLNCFSMIAKIGRCSPGTMWCTHSCLKCCIVVKHNVIIKYFYFLLECIKRIARHHIASKPDMLLNSEIKLGLITLFDDQKEKDLMTKACVATMHCGVLRHLWILLIQIKDVYGKEEGINVKFTCKIKCRVK